MVTVRLDFNSYGMSWAIHLASAGHAFWCWFPCASVDVLHRHEPRGTPKSNHKPSMHAYDSSHARNCRYQTAQTILRPSLRPHEHIGQEHTTHKNSKRERRRPTPATDNDEVTTTAEQQECRHPCKQIKHSTSTPQPACSTGVIQKTAQRFARHRRGMNIGPPLPPSLYREGPAAAGAWADVRGGK